ncbi:MAG: hypothetical protein JWN34_4750 [Bryobacterales bacterium]|jgi:hypothetical protein|nr:hypothetical protein [Bryobacterales bacterium]
MTDPKLLPPAKPAATKAELLQTVEALSMLTPNDPSWPRVMRDVLDLPMSYLPVVIDVLRARHWVQAHDAVAALRRQAINKSARLESMRPRNPVPASRAGIGWTS